MFFRIFFISPSPFPVFIILKRVLFIPFGLALFYLFLIIVYAADYNIIYEALTRVIIFTFIAGVITFISLRRRQAEANLIREKNQLHHLLNLHQSPDTRIEDIESFVMEECIKISDSRLGFWGVTNEDETIMMAHLWSEEAMKGCRIDFKPVEFVLEHAGIWAEAIREHKPLIVNDYSRPDPRKKGYPKGHVPIQRLMSIPVIRNAKAVAIVAVANKEQNYDESDFLHISLFLESVWGIIQRKKVEKALSLSEAYFRSLIENSSDMITILDADGIIRYDSISVKRILGYEPSELVGRNVFELIHPEDLQELKEAFERAVQTPGTTPSMVFRFRHKDSSWSILESVGQNLLENDEVKGLVVNSHDVTARKQAEDALRESEARLNTLVHTIPDLVWLKDYDGLYLACNPMFERFFGAREADIIGRTDYDFVDKELADFFREKDYKAMAMGKPSVNEEWITFADDGHRAFLETVKTPMYDSKGTLIGVLGISRDITERKRAEEEILALSNTDQLTGLRNRRGFLTLTAQQLKLSDRTKRGLIFFFADLDGMKFINDTFGHEEGDKALTDIAFILKEAFRSSDIISRMGGDEFAVLAIDPEEIDPESIIQRLKKIIETHNDHANRKYKLSVSVGYSFYDPENPISVDDLMMGADKSMYEQKKHKMSPV